RRGQPDSGRVPHRLAHQLHKLLDLGAPDLVLGEGPGRLSQDRVARLHDLQNHAEIVGRRAPVHGEPPYFSSSRTDLSASIGRRSAMPVVDLVPRRECPTVRDLVAYSVGYPTPEKMDRVLQRYADDPARRLVGFERGGSLDGYVGFEIHGA